MTDKNRTVLITGSNRGMGIEHARQYGADGWRVIATCRNPSDATDLLAVSDSCPSVEVHALDVTDQSSVDALATELAGQPVDILLSNASHITPPDRQQFGQADYDDYIESFEVNALGPFRMANAFYDHVSRSHEKKMIFMGSQAGSTALLQPPMVIFGYCAAKAALHNLARGLHLHLAPEGFIVNVLEPGLVDTQGFLDVKPGDPAPLGLDHIVEMIQSGERVMARPADAVAKLRTLIAGLTPDQSGQFLNIDGQVVPW